LARLSGERKNSWRKHPRFVSGHRFSDFDIRGIIAPSGAEFMDHFFHLDDLNRQRADKGKLYREFLRVPAMSAGVYVLPKGGIDPQKPHREDEMYYVVRGRAHIQIASESKEVRAGSVIFVEAEAEHRFYDIQEELEVLVFFAPAEAE
jgi:mannose-6-phosphate isomerase-like protein (cupin superfamily)